MADMDSEALFLSEDQLEIFVRKLALFRRTLSQPEQRVFDVLLTACETEEADVQGYLLLEDALARRAALAAVDRLSRRVGPLHPSPQGLFHRLEQASRPARP
jgi:hypothetical protein